MKITEEMIPLAAAIAATREGVDSDMVREIAAAALNAWEGACIRTRMQPDPDHGGQWILPQPMLSLPLPKDGADEWEALKGAAPDCTGSKSSEDFIREERDKWS